MEQQGVAGWDSKGFCVVSHFAKADMIRFREGLLKATIHSRDMKIDCLSWRIFLLVIFPL